MKYKKNKSYEERRHIDKENRVRDNVKMGGSTPLLKFRYSFSYDKIPNYVLSDCFTLTVEGFDIIKVEFQKCFDTFVRNVIQNEKLVSTFKTHNFENAFN